MNEARRKRIVAIVEKLSAIEVDLENVRDEEEEAFENMPESLQSSEHGVLAVEAIDALAEATEFVGNAVTTLRNIV